jgi:hypothetical protein
MTDTIETNEPVGSDGATSSPDTSQNDTQPIESTDSFSEGNVDEVGEAPTLLAGKYASTEELEKAYTELQGKLGEQGQKAELANLIERQTGMNANQIKEALLNQQQQQYQQQVQENPGLAAFNEVTQLKQQLALQNEQKELDNFISSEEGKPYQGFKDKILNLGLNLERGKSYGEIARDYFGQAIAQGQQSAYKKIDTKLMTQATGASQSAPKGRLTSEDMDKLSSQELEAILPHADTSQRLY